MRYSHHISHRLDLEEPGGPAPWQLVLCIDSRWEITALYDTEREARAVLTFACAILARLGGVYHANQ